MTDLQKIREIMPNAIIRVEQGNYSIVYDVKFLRPIPEKQHDELFPKIKEALGKKFIERFTEEAGIHFKIYAKK